MTIEKSTAGKDKLAETTPQRVSEEASRRLFEDIFNTQISAAQFRASEKFTEPPPDKPEAIKENGRTTTIKKGEDSFNITYDDKGNISKLEQNMAGGTVTYEAGKDFKLGDAKVAPDGKSIKIDFPDKKMSLTLRDDFSSELRKIGDKGDGSDDKILSVRTREGVLRDFKYDEKGELKQIVDRLRTNQGELVDTIDRIGNTNVFSLSSNYGRKGLYNNLVVDSRNGTFSAQEIQRAKPNDLINQDNDNIHKTVVPAREALVAKAKEYNVFGGSTAEIEKWCRGFEDRCKKLAHEGKRSPSDDQIAETYNQLNKILAANAKIGRTSKRYLIESALKEYADPKKHINQGSHPSCAFATTERHIVQTHPELHAKLLHDAVTEGRIHSHPKSGLNKGMALSDQQIKMDSESYGKATGKGWDAAWSYSNKIAQIALIKLGYHGRYTGNGHGFPGGGEDQMDYANKFVTGEKGMYLVNSWGGRTGSFEKLQQYLKHGTVGYWVPGHSMSIDDAKIVNGQKWVHVDNWWGGTGDGWRRWERV